MEENTQESERPIVLKESRTPGGSVYVWDDEDEISIYSLLRPLVRYWGTIVIAMLLFGLAAVAYSIRQPTSYTSEAKFYPQTAGGSRLSNLSGVAAQFGINVGGQEPGKSPVFFANLLETEQILESTVRTTYAIDDSLAEEGQPLQGDLITLLEIEGRTPEVRLASARSRLKNEFLYVQTDQETGVITVTVTTPWSDLSAAIGERMLELLNEFNLEIRQSQAAMERQFIEEQLEESQQALAQAEGTLQRFLERTRRIGSSPTLTFERDRLRRQVDLRQALYTSLAAAYQQVRIDEGRDIPVITVIDRPTVPTAPDGNRLQLNFLLGLVLGGMIGTGLAYGRSFVARSEEERDEEYEEFLHEFRRAFAGPRRAVRRVRSLLPGESTTRERD